MPDVEITKRVRLNLNGYDREATDLEPGTHTVPEHAASWVRRNPSFGHVLGEAAAESEPAEDISAGDVLLTVYMLRHTESGEYVIESDGGSFLTGDVADGQAFESEAEAQAVADGLDDVEVVRVDIGTDDNEAATDLASLTVDELRARASEAGVEGRSAMNKDQLVEALTALADQPEAEE